MTGIMAAPYSKTHEGYEIQFGTNHMGHALLTRLLLPTLLKTAEKPGSDVRVVNVSSEAHQLASGIIYDQDQLGKCNTWTRYGNSKLANILHARELQKQNPTITATALHPGVIVTGLYTTVPMGWLVLPILRLFTTSIPGGAKNSLWAATAPKDEVRGCFYWKPVAIRANGTKYAQDEKLAKELWDWTEEQLKKHE